MFVKSAKGSISVEFFATSVITVPEPVLVVTLVKSIVVVGVLGVLIEAVVRSLSVSTTQISVLRTTTSSLILGLLESRIGGDGIASAIK